MAQHLWRAVGLCKLTALSCCNITRLSSSLQPVKASGPSDPVKRKAPYDRKKEFRRMKRLTDPEWTLRDRAFTLKRVNKHRASLTDEQLQENLRRNAEAQRTRWAEDPEVRFRQWLSNLLRQHAWVRERLPWKHHSPVLYKDKVQHTCNTCLVPRFPGAYRLWWASHDGKHYQCNACHSHGSNIMPEGYEDVSSMTELRKRMDELGH